MLKKQKYVMLKDEVANILTDKDCKDYVEMIVSKAIGIKKEEISLELLSDRINTNVNIKYSTVDAIYEDNSFIVNIEVNTSNIKETTAKNMRYLCHLILK